MKNVNVIADNNSLKRVLLAFCYAADAGKASSSFARLILKTMLDTLGIQRRDIPALKAYEEQTWINIRSLLSSLIIFGPSAELREADSEEWEKLNADANDFMMAAACNLAVSRLWSKAITEIINENPDEASYYAGQSRLIDQLITDVGMINALFSGKLKIPTAKDENNDWAVVDDLEDYFDRKVKSRREYRDAHKDDVKKPEKAKPKRDTSAPVKKGFFARLFGR